MAINEFQICVFVRLCVLACVIPGSNVEGSIDLQDPLDV